MATPHHPTPSGASPQGEAFYTIHSALFFIDILFISKESTEPRHYGGVFVIQKAMGFFKHHRSFNIHKSRKIRRRICQDHRICNQTVWRVKRWLTALGLIFACYGIFLVHSHRAASVKYKRIGTAESLHIPRHLAIRRRGFTNGASSIIGTVNFSRHRDHNRSTVGSKSDRRSIRAV